MTTNLTTVPDHPAVLLDDLGDRMSDQKAHAAAAYLTDYETNHDVTFAALDNSTLAWVRDAYEKNADDGGHSLRAAICDLLGLAD